MSDLTWALKLADQMSMPALKMARSVDNIISSLKSTDSALRQTDSSLRNVGASFQSAATEAMGTSKAIDKVYESSMKAVQGIDRLSDAMRRMHITQGAADSDELMMKLQALKNTQAKDDIGVEMAKLDKIVKAKNLRNAAMGFARETGADQANIAGWREKFETGGIIKMRNEYNRLTEAAEKSARAMAVSKVESQLLSKSKPGDPSIVQRMIGGFGNLFGAKATGKLMGGMESLSKWDDELNKVGLSLGGVVAGGAAIATTAVLAVAAAVAAVVVGLSALAVKGTMAFSQLVIERGRFREDTMAELKAMLKSDTEASKVFQIAAKFAKETPFSSEAVVGGFKDLLAGGFKTDELSTWMTTIGDTAAVVGQDRIPDLVRSLSKLRGTGKLTEEILEPLRLNREMLAKNAGVSVDQLSGLDGKKAEAAIKKTLDDMYGGSMKNKAETLTGMLSNVSDSVKELMDKAFDASKGKGTGITAFFDTIKGGVKDLMDALSGKSGDTAVDFINRLGNSLNVVATIMRGFLGGLFAGFTGGMNDSARATQELTKADLEKMGRDAAEVGKSFGKIAKALGEITTMLPSMKSLETALTVLKVLAIGTAVVVGAAGLLFFGAWIMIFGIPMLLLGLALGAIGALVVGVVELYDWLSGSGTKASAALQSAMASVKASIASFSLLQEGMNIGASLIDGLTAGIMGGVAAAAGAAGGAAAAMANAARVESKTHSPSRVFEQIGGYMSEGLAQGVTRKAPMAAGAVADMVTPPSPSSVAGQWSSAGSSGSSSRQGPTVVIENLTIQAENPDDYERKTISLWESIALQLNGAPA